MGRIDNIMKILRKHYPGDAGVSSKYNPFQALIATVLSQRTRDEKTIIASRQLFAEYPDAKSLADADPKHVKELIKPAGFYNMKTPRIIDISRILMEKYNGKVPHDEDLMLELPGVGRKTMNCVLVYGFNEIGMPVDTHVLRISNRLGLVDTKSADETEFALKKVLDKKYWLDYNRVIVLHGQTICRPISPKCGECPIFDLCERKGVKWPR